MARSIEQRGHHVTCAFQLAGKGYKDFDYTLVIAIMQLLERTIIGLKLTLVVEIKALLSSGRPPLLDRSLDVRC